MSRSCMDVYVRNQFCFVKSKRYTHDGISDPQLTTIKVSYIVTCIYYLMIQTDRPGQTVQTQIRLLLEEQSDQGLHCRNSLIWVCTVCHSVCIVWTHYSLVKPHSSNFRVIITNILGVRIFRKFTVNQKECVHKCFQSLSVSEVHKLLVIWFLTFSR